MLKKILKHKSKISYLGFLGFLGFMGFAKSFQGEPQYMFFSFFGFFSYFFIGTIASEATDERMEYNNKRARLVLLKFYSIILASLWIFIMLNPRMFHIEYVSIRLIELLYALVFAATFILYAFLIYYYEKVE